MELSSYAESKTFFEFSCEVSDSKMANFQSLKGRAYCLLTFFEKIFILPFALGYKSCITFFKVVGVFFSASFLVSTFGTSGSARQFFARRVSSLALDLVDWVFYPFAVFSCLSKLLLASLFHPALFLGF